MGVGWSHQTFSNKLNILRLQPLLLLDMETTRQSKISRLILKELGETFLTETRNMPGVLISVSTVRVSPDLSIAKAYLSIFPSDKSQEILENINRHAKDIRHEISQRVRYQLRRMPNLVFYIDDSLDYLEKIDSLLK